MASRPYNTYLYHHSTHQLPYFHPNPHYILWCNCHVYKNQARMSYHILPLQLYNQHNQYSGNMNEASSSSSFPQQLAEITEENRVSFYSNDFHLQPESYNYYQQPDHRAIGGYPLMIDYCQSTSIDNNHSSIQQPLKKLPEWQCPQATEDPRKRMKVGSDEKVVNKKLKHLERMQETERMPMRRSQKLADKITALQKLVSPYGKTDTASVLEEAHISINLLHHKIQELLHKTETLTDNHGSLQFQSNETRLQNRGLCLVPISNPQINRDQNFMPRN